MILGNYVYASQLIRAICDCSHLRFCHTVPDCMKLKQYCVTVVKYTDFCTLSTSPASAHLEMKV